jgi:hypothetical protein
MNKDRRAAIDEAITTAGVLLESAQSDEDWDRSAAQEGVSALKETIEGIRDEEQEYFDNMPEGFQNGDRGSTAQEAIDNLEAAASDLDEIYWNDDDEPDAEVVASALESAIDNLQSAKG